MRWLSHGWHGLCELHFNWQHASSPIHFSRKEYPMKAKTFVACAFAISALALAPAWATMPSGPQGTGAYGAPNAAVPLPQTVPPGHIVVGPQVVPDDSAHRDLLADQTAIDRDARPADPSRPARRWVLQGPSWATNPPAPAP
jgi:hypothetical protein